MRTDEARELCEEWARLLGLGDWTLTVDGVDEEALEDGVSPAEVIYRGDIREATVRVALRCDRETLEKRIIHELCHILLRDIVEIVDAAAAVLGTEARAVWSSMVGVAQERTVVQLARAVNGVRAGQRQGSKDGQDCQDDGRRH